jgi:Trypsin-like peptidase domain
MRSLLVCLTVLVWPVALLSQQTDLNVVLMRTTFLVQGATKTPVSITYGTAFLLLRPFSSQPSAQRTDGKAVLVTAAHVFDEMNGDSAVILLRTQQSGTEQWIVRPARLPIRRNGEPLWKKHPDADVAVMYVNWPSMVPVSVVPTNILADDDMLKKTDVVPGVELKILGYPLGSPSNDAGFPILRTGVIASYPLLPTSGTKTFLLDFRVFKGNSGGPVYFSQPVVKGSAYMCCPPQFIMGLVSKEKSLDMPYSQLQLSLGEIIHASIIKAAIELLPAPETHDADAIAVPIELLPTQAAHP